MLLVSENKSLHHKWKKLCREQLFSILGTSFWTTGETCVRKVFILRLKNEDICDEGQFHLASTNSNKHMFQHFQTTFSITGTKSCSCEAKNMPHKRKSQHCEFSNKMFLNQEKCTAQVLVLSAAAAPADFRFVQGVSPAGTHLHESN